VQSAPCPGTVETGRFRNPTPVARDRHADQSKIVCTHAVQRDRVDRLADKYRKMRNVIRECLSAGTRFLPVVRRYVRGLELHNMLPEIIVRFYAASNGPYVIYRVGFFRTH
jgi:hypothetical protein